jgi:hypothetical protein
MAVFRTGSGHQLLLHNIQYSMKNKYYILMLVFWVITPCGLVGRYQRVGGTYFHV